MATLVKSEPASMEKLCTRKILDNILLSCGRKIEERARAVLGASATAGSGSSSDQRSQTETSPYKRKRRSSTTILASDEPDSMDFFTQTEYFQEQSSNCRRYLSTHLSSCTLDNLVSEVQQLSHRSGFFFALSSLCSDRLSHLPISPSFFWYGIHLFMKKRLSALGSLFTMGK